MAGYRRRMWRDWVGRVWRGRAWQRRRHESLPPPPVDWTRDQILGFIEFQARKRRGISGAELLASYRAGTLESPGEVADLIALANLLLDDDPIFQPT